MGERDTPHVPQPRYTPAEVLEPLLWQAAVGRWEQGVPYHVLDPGLNAEGRFLARWRLRLNVDPDELRAVGGT